MPAVEIIGYLAAALVFATFYMKTMIALRAVAVASNVAFIGYGYLGAMVPILILHAALLPLNLWRLKHSLLLVKRLRLSTRGDPGLDCMMPYMTSRSFAVGETIFRRGEAAREMFLITAGTVRLTELKIEVGTGAMFGEIGLFSPDKARTATAVAATAVDVLAIAEDRVIAIYNDNREFGTYLIALITQRLVANFDALERQAAASIDARTCVSR